MCKCTLNLAKTIYNRLQDNISVEYYMQLMLYSNIFNSKPSMYTRCKINNN